MTYSLFGKHCDFLEGIACLFAGFLFAFLFYSNENFHDFENRASPMRWHT